MPKIKNILIFIIILAVLVLIYIFFIQPSSSSAQTNLVSSSGTTTTPTTSSTGSTSGASSVGQDFLTILLGVKNIQLNTDIFSDPAFLSLHDSSVTLTPDATTGRINPFAPFGAGNTGAVPVATSTQQITPVVPVVPAPVSVPVSIPVVHKSTTTPATATSTHP